MSFCARHQTLAACRYGLQACRNLEQVFIAAGDREAVHCFQLRQRFYARKISKLEVAQ
jgi:hypothetical protein